MTYALCALLLLLLLTTDDALLCGFSEDKTQVSCLFNDFIAGSVANITLTFRPTTVANMSASATVLPEDSVGGVVYDINPDNNFAETCMNMVSGNPTCALV